MTGFAVISGHASEDLAKRIDKRLDAKYIKTDLRAFPDGESKVTIRGNLREIPIIVQSTAPPVDSNLIQALF